MMPNRLEFALMNNPLRAAVQKHLEARLFLRMGGRLPGAKVLEIGCGRGVGVELILDVFGAKEVDAFDLDPRMIAIARRRLNARGATVRVWVGDAAAINAAANSYDAVFDFGIIHHVPNWRTALVEVHRVLRPGGLFFAEEPLGSMLNHPLMHRLVAHPVEDRFEAADFRSAMQVAGMTPLKEKRLWLAMGWLVAQKPIAAQN
jgi:ubiquinone/menaquinone biosynthesis C-methylase UbiE